MRPELQNAITELRKDDPESMDRAIGLLQQTAFAFNMKVCGHRQDAEDTAQETLLQTVATTAAIRQPGSARFAGIPAARLSLASITERTPGSESL